jgi:release factor glutamine methyltransferase
VIREALSASVDALRAVGIEEPRLDAELLLAEATGWDRARIAAATEAELPPPAARRFGELVRRRLRREPVAYILGRRGFRELELEVDPRVLIPRPETELLVELALELAPRRVLDVGTGSGAVALAIAAELPGCEVVATDTSAAALEVARANAERLGFAERVTIGDLSVHMPRKSPIGTRITLEEGTLPPGLGGFDLIVANLPYVSESEWAGLAPEVRDWEPREALLAGADGLDAIRLLLSDRVRLVSALAGPTANGAPAALALEVGAGQAAAVAGLLQAAGLGATETRADLAGIERVVIGRSAQAR